MIVYLPVHVHVIVGDRNFVVCDVCCDGYVFKWLVCAFMVAIVCVFVGLLVGLADIS